MSEKICISDAEMISSLGLDVGNACAAARAGITRLSQLKTINSVGNEILGPDPILGHVAPCGISHGFQGQAKLLTLGGYALKKLLARNSLERHELMRTGVYVNLSDTYMLGKYFSDYQDGEESDNAGTFSGQKSVRQEERIDQRNFLERLLVQVNLTIPSENLLCYSGGRAGAAHVIKEAMENIVAGNIDRCIVGAVDSYIGPELLEAAAKYSLLKTAKNPVGYMPGEAAVFIILERFSSVSSITTSTVIDTLAFSSEDTERIGDKPPLGVALADVVEEVLSKASYIDFGLIIGDLNGDDFRAIEWGHMIVRLEEKYKVGMLPLWLPAIHFGETGAATGLISLCMGNSGFQRGYSQLAGTIIVLSGENGNKAAMSIYPTNI